MNRTFIFAFILLVTLSIVNATPIQLNKRETKFGQCQLFPDVPILDVKISPDPIQPEKDITFEISGTLNNDIDNSTFLSIWYFQPDNLAYGICSDPSIPCPIKAGTKFSLKKTSPAPPKEEFPDIEFLAVSIFEKKETPEIYGCAQVNITLTS